MAAVLRVTVDVPDALNATVVPCEVLAGVVDVAVVGAGLGMVAGTGAGGGGGCNMLSIAARWAGIAHASATTSLIAIQARSTCAYRTMPARPHGAIRRHPIDTASRNAPISPRTTAVAPCHAITLNHPSIPGGVPAA